MGGSRSGRVIGSSNYCEYWCDASCDNSIGVAKFFSGGGGFFPEKVDDLFIFVIVALKTQSKITKLSTPTVQISPIS